ncbi:MAG: hypothetical protein K0S65_1775 [Labilithrix sp.]|nr:hypothetical protein [Labilithrix sp.]
MSTSFGRWLACLVFVGCGSQQVMLVAPVEEVRGTCFSHCETLFGARPTLNCGERKEPLHVLVCTYDSPSRPEPNDPRAGPPAHGEAETICRTACARAGLETVEACWTLQMSDAQPAVACRYRVGHH